MYIVGRDAEVCCVGLGSAQTLRIDSVQTEAERVASGIEQDAEVWSWLMLGEARSRGESESHCGFKVVDLDIEVNHLGLSARLLRPHRWLVPWFFLEREAGAAARVLHADVVVIAVGHLPAEKATVELCHHLGVGAVHVHASKV